MRIQILILILSVFSMFANAQKSSPELEELLNSATKFIESNPVKAIDKAEKAFQLTIKEQDTLGQSRCYYLIAVINHNAEDYKGSLGKLKKALLGFNQYSNKNGIYNTNKYIAKCKIALGSSDAELSLTKFLKLAKESGNAVDEKWAKNSLGELKYKQKDYIQSRNFYQQVEQQAITDNNEADLTVVYNNLGKVSEVLNDTIEALDYYQKSYSIADKNGDNAGITNYWSNVSDYYGARGDTTNLIQTNQSAIDYYETNNSRLVQINGTDEFLNANSEASNLNVDAANNLPNTVNYGNTNELTSLAASNLNMGKLYLQQKNPTDAISYIERSIEIASKEGQLVEEAQGYEVLMDAYEKQGEFDKALAAYKSYMRLRDSLTIENTDKLNIKNELKSDIRDRDKKIDLIEKERDLDLAKFEFQLRKQRQEAKDKDERNKWLLLSLLAGMGVLAIAFLFFWKGSRDKKKANKLLMLKSLRTQMNPHFIFNSLNSVNSFISQSDERSANKYLAEFSKLMRMVLENSKHDFVTLSSELKTLELYLSLEHLRFKDKFEFQFDVDVIGTEDIMVPPMLIQPYIENSVWHGLRYKEGKGALKVSCIEDGDNLKWTIEDDGIGRGKSREIKTKHQRQGKSTGMKNINERIRIFKEVYKHEMKLDISNLNEDGTGTKVEMTIPKRQKV